MAKKKKKSTLIIKSGKRQIREGMDVPNPDKFTTLREMENHKYLGILEADTVKQVKMKSIFKIIAQENEKTTRNQTTEKKSNLNDK